MLEIDSQTGLAVISPEVDADALVDELLSTGYPGEFCLAASFCPGFIARLVASGFLVMSFQDSGGRSLLLPKLHQVRTAVDPADLHEPRSARRLLSRYELRADDDLAPILDRCAKEHGEDWLTPELRAGFLSCLFPPQPRFPAVEAPRPLAFGLYREGQLVAGEFGFAVGSVYTSYSGYHGENSSGTVQLVLTGRELRARGYTLWDLGMPMGYKEKLGARNLCRANFIGLYREARKRKLSNERS